MREYVLCVLGAGLITALILAAMPSGGLKKFAAPVLGLIMISVVLRPLRGFDDIAANIESQIPVKSEYRGAESAIQEYEEKILREYEKRLEDEIEKRAGQNSSAKVKVDGEGRISGVVVNTKAVPPPGLESFIINELGAPQKQVKIIAKAGE